ncbi:arsenic resistance N-acetyltransferase ArsN2 [Meiothermus granaticius]|uniref:Amino-acid acetyltransferase n=1 Tax=Meiothermus granaticius NBRC 107808 TaxID=1227551 RepID=A0A399F6A8_9DEIN|nr:arsenic resistance N-acetyltransferase ArsN2 [Meiothermus granaticius]MCL6525872.1 arsenic resistance N-acetyltransferase ArsN2 [Thermaceae bacterium]RIH92194.1 Amino-acid acetyltransferase [Meiothermus granaticius NBRC 107808]GEM85628.1 hypothetical protein MGR01S_02530 [Meiothermus granaticius NBRC 107808]
MISFCTATSADLPEVFRLLQASGLPIAGVPEHIHDFILALDGERVVACAGLETHSEAGLLRSLAVEADYRSQGLGGKLTQGILELAESRGLHSVSLLTTTAQNYFSRFGFVPVERSALPPALAASEELRGVCSERAAAMTLAL